MAKKNKVTFKKIKQTALKEAKSAHNQLRLITIVVYIILFASWFILKYDLIYLVAGILVAMLVRIGAAYWFYTQISAQKKKK